MRLLDNSSCLVNFSWIFIVIEITEQRIEFLCTASVLVDASHSKRPFWLLTEGGNVFANRMTSNHLSLFCWFLGFLSVASCVPASPVRSARAVDYAAQAEKILDETPLVDG